MRGSFAEESTDVPLEDGAETPDSPAVVSKRKAQDVERAEEPSSVGHVNEKRRCRLKPSQSLVSLQCKAVDAKRSAAPCTAAPGRLCCWAVFAGGLGQA